MPKKNKYPCTTPGYSSWIGMKERCLNHRSKDYKLYGNVKICDRWINSFDNFMDDLGPKPKGRYSIDRINTNGDYTPENCRWADDTMQNNNRNFNVRITHNGTTKTICEWAKYLCINRRTIEQRIKYGWNIERVLFTPIQNSNYKINKNKSNYEL